MTFPNAHQMPKAAKSKQAGPLKAKVKLQGRSLPRGDPECNCILSIAAEGSINHSPPVPNSTMQIAPTLTFRGRTFALGCSLSIPLPSVPICSGH